MIFWDDDGGVSPVIGYILTFAITSGFLLITLTTSSDLLDRKHVEAARVMFTDLAHRMANGLEESMYVVGTNPDADYEKRIPLPRDIRGFEYQVDVNNTHVWVNATNGHIRTDTVVHNPSDRTVEGSIQRRLVALISYDPSTEIVTLKGGD